MVRRTADRDIGRKADTAQRASAAPTQLFRCDGRALVRTVPRRKFAQWHLIAGQEHVREVQLIRKSPRNRLRERPGKQPAPSLRLENIQRRAVRSIACTARRDDRQRLSVEPDRSRGGRTQARVAGYMALPVLLAPVCSCPATGTRRCGEHSSGLASPRPVVKY